MPLAQQSGFDISGIYAWLSKDMCQIDASLADQQFHTNPPLLQLNEVCEVAFQCRKDLVLLTSKRILFINKEDKIGAKFSFTSFPYSSIKAVKERQIAKNLKNLESPSFPCILGDHCRQTWQRYGSGILHWYLVWFANLSWPWYQSRFCTLKMK